MSGARWAALVAAAAVLAVAGWFGWWALARANADQQYQVNTSDQQYQASLVSQERDRASGWADATVPAQKTAIAQQFCAVYDDLTHPPADLTAAHDQICR